MKRIVLTALVLTALLSFVCILLLQWLTVDPTAPSFQKARVPVVVGHYKYMGYDFGSASPFEGGKMWINVWSSRAKDYHRFLYDIDRRLVLGELNQAGAVFFNHDQTKLLCYMRARPPTNHLRDDISEIIKSLSGGKIDLAHARQDVETFWTLDLPTNTAKKLGHLYQHQGTGSSFRPSPDFRFGYNKPSMGMSKGFFICDLEKDIFRNDPVAGEPKGWWDERRILIKATDKSLVLYDVVTRKTSPFLSLEQLGNFYASVGITNDPAQANPFFMWNGRENDFYLTDKDQRWSAAESFLLKIARPGPTLTLLNPKFKFEWSDHFDATGNYYLYTGRDPGKTNSAVYLRDLRSNQTRELVAPDPNEGTQFSIPFFYRAGVIYVRSNMLWQIDLDGSNNRRLFPPPDGVP